LPLACGNVVLGSFALSTPLQIGIPDIWRHTASITRPPGLRLSRTTCFFPFSISTIASYLMASFSPQRVPPLPLPPLLSSPPFFEQGSHHPLPPGYSPNFVAFFPYLTLLLQESGVTTVPPSPRSFLQPVSLIFFLPPIHFPGFLFKKPRFSDTPPIKFFLDPSLPVYSPPSLQICRLRRTVRGFTCLTPKHVCQDRRKFSFFDSSHCRSTHPFLKTPFPLRFSLLDGDQ